MYASTALVKTKRFFVLFSQQSRFSVQINAAPADTVAWMEANGYCPPAGYNPPPWIKATPVNDDVVTEIRRSSASSPSHHSSHGMLGYATALSTRRVQPTSSRTASTVSDALIMSL
jgi:hypothetical protein